MNRRAFLAGLAVVAAAPRELWSFFSSGPALEAQTLTVVPSPLRLGVEDRHPSMNVDEMYSLICDPEGGPFVLRQGRRLLRTIASDDIKVGDTLSLRSDGQVSVNGHVI